MESKIIREFKGEINGISFSDQEIYRISESLLENIEQKFGIAPKNFTEDLRDTIGVIMRKSETFDAGILKENVFKSAYDAKKLKELSIEYNGKTWKIVEQQDLGKWRVEDINQNLQEGKYNFDTSLLRLYKAYNLYVTEEFSMAPSPFKEFLKEKTIGILSTDQMGRDGNYEVQIEYDFKKKEEIISVGSEYVNVITRRHVPIEDAIQNFSNLSFEDFLNDIPIDYDVLDRCEALAEQEDINGLEKELQKVPYSMSFTKEGIDEKLAEQMDLTEHWRKAALKMFEKHGNVFILTEQKQLQFKNLDELDNNEIFNNTTSLIRGIATSTIALEKLISPDVKGYFQNGSKYFTANIATISNPTIEELKSKEYQPSFVTSESGIVKIDEIKEEVAYKLEHGLTTFSYFPEDRVKTWAEIKEEIDLSEDVKLEVYGMSNHGNRNCKVYIPYGEYSGHVLFGKYNEDSDSITIEDTAILYDGASERYKLALDALKKDFSEISTQKNTTLQESIKEEKEIITSREEALKFLKDYNFINDSFAYKKIKNFSEELRDDKEIMSLAVRGIGQGVHIAYASERLKDDDELALAAVSTNGYAITDISYRLQSEKNIALEAVKNAAVLPYLYDYFHDDKEIVLAAIQHNGESLQFASDRLKNDKEIVLAAIADKGWAIKFASEELRGNKEVMREAIKIDTEYFKYATPKLQLNKNFINEVRNMEEERLLRNPWEEKSGKKGIGIGD